MLLINLFGAPGAGKSTGAAYIFSKIKMEGVNAELVTEYAKDKVWEKSEEVFNNQVYIFGKQYFRISRLEKKVDVVVTDSPLLLSAYYSDNPLLDGEFDALVNKIAKSYDCLNIFINRVKPYNESGRFQTEQESDLVGVELKEFLDENGVDYIEYDGCIESYNAIVELILSKLSQKD